VRRSERPRERAVPLDDFSNIGRLHAVDRPAEHRDISWVLDRRLPLTRGHASATLHRLNRWRGLGLSDTRVHPSARTEPYALAVPLRDGFRAEHVEEQRVRRNRCARELVERALRAARDGLAIRDLLLHVGEQRFCIHLISSRLDVW